MRDRNTGYHYLYAMGKGDDASAFETIDPKLLPPQLGIGDSFEALAEDPQARARLELDTKNVRRVLPHGDRYQGLENGDKFADDHVAITLIDYWQAQAMAQLLGDGEIAQEIFGVGGLSGDFYADLLTNEQWGLMAMEGVLEYMTRTGKLTDDYGGELRAHDLCHIVRATDYPPLPNGVLPNTVWNWVKDSNDQGGYQVRRGGSWGLREPPGRRLDPDDLCSAYRCFFDSDVGDSPHIGARVAFFPRA